MTSEEYGLAFTLLDNRARRNGGFVCEFFLSRGRYWICLRPVEREGDNPSHYPCKYAQVSVGDISAILSKRALSTAVVGAIDDALAVLLRQC